MPAPNPCNSDPCGNNGICENLGTRFICECQDEFTGDLCENGEARWDLNSYPQITYLNAVLRFHIYEGY